MHTKKCVSHTNSRYHNVSRIKLNCFHGQICLGQLIQTPSAIGHAVSHLFAYSHHHKFRLVAHQWKKKFYAFNLYTKKPKTRNTRANTTKRQYINATKKGSQTTTKSNVKLVNQIEQLRASGWFSLLCMEVMRINVESLH